MNDDNEYYECTVCSYGTNSADRADDHEFDYGHLVQESAL